MISAQDVVGIEVLRAGQGVRSFEFRVMGIFEVTRGWFRKSHTWIAEKCVVDPSGTLTLLRGDMMEMSGEHQWTPSFYLCHYPRGQWKSVRLIKDASDD